MLVQFREAALCVVEFRRSDTAEKIMKLDYLSLKNVYNSLRYVKKQLKYRSLRIEEEWWIAKKLARLVGGFDYAYDNGLEVPAGLKKFYEIYRNNGIVAMLEKIREWLGINGELWRYIIRKLVMVYNLKLGILEYKYGLRRNPKNIIIKGVNDRCCEYSIEKFMPMRTN